MTQISQVHQFAEHIGQLLEQQHLKLTTAESCTGGQLAQTITSIPGASKWFERGFISYSNLSKQELLSVKKNTLQRYGAVSQKTAKEMAEGALKMSPADISIAITGIVGPSDRNEEQPVGTIYFAWAHRNTFCEVSMRHFDGDRLIIRYNAVEFALKQLILLISKNVK
jgi:nicotinamide-nucleotide amidase